MRDFSINLYIPSMFDPVPLHYCRCPYSGLLNWFIWWRRTGVNYIGQCLPRLRSVTIYLMFLSTLSLKTPCYGVFVCAVRAAYGLTHSPSIPSLSTTVGNNKRAHLMMYPFIIIWWRRTGSNRWPLECHSSALPAELRPRNIIILSYFDGFCKY